MRWDDYEQSTIGITAGYAVMLSDNISFNPALGYAMVTADDGTWEYKYSGIAFVAGIAVHLGNQ